MATFAVCSTSYAQTNTPAPAQNPPLTDAENREVLQRLYDYKAALDEVQELQADKAQQEKLADQERALFKRQIELEQQATALAQKEADLYKEAYTNLKKQKNPGFMSKVLPFIIGIAVRSAIP